MNFLTDRATEAAANDLAEVRKLIEGMNALVNSQQQQQQLQQMQQQQQQQLEEQRQQQQQQQAQQQAQQQQQQQQQQQAQQAQQQQQQQQLQQKQLQQHQKSQEQQKQEQRKQQEQASQANATAGTNEADKPWPSTDGQTQNNAQYNQQQQTTQNMTTTATGVIIEVNHLTFTRVLYFQLSPDATIEPLIAWLRISFQDTTISGMVLQYKGFDGLWKCLLNRDDSLRRVLKQSLKNNTMLQMRVPREQDLLSSGYTDRRLLALTTKPNA